MKHLQKEFLIEDDKVPSACLEGLPILGKAAVSPFFDSSA